MLIDKGALAMTNNKPISAHQAGVIAGILLFTLKMTSLPSLIYEYTKTGAVLATAVVMALNILFLCVIVWLKKKFGGLSLYEIFEKYLGKIFTKILYLSFFAFFILKILLMVSDGFTFIIDVADEEFSVFHFFICFFPLITAVAYSGIRTISRTCEFFFPFIIISLILTLTFSFVGIGTWGLGSVTQVGFGGYVESIYKLSFWTGDLFALLIFVDKIQIKKGEIKHLFTPFIIMVAFLMAIFIVYFTLYKETTIFHTNVLYDIIQYAIGASTGWHMDIFAIIVFMLNLFLQGSILMYCASSCLEKVFEFKESKIYLFFSNVVLLMSEYLFLNDYLEYIYFAKNYLCHFSTINIILVNVILLYILIFKKGENRKNANAYKTG